ncbi:MAG: DUF1508 domain-containing protein [Clostridiales bacterium]|nr:DUF1508 domain-containing protein [Clostridiales bacterium]
MMLANLLASFMQNNAIYLVVLGIILALFAGAFVLVWLFKVLFPKKEAERNAEVAAFLKQESEAEEPVVEEVKEEPVAEEPVAQEVKEEPVVEEPAAQEVKEEPVVEEPAAQEVKEEPVAEEPAAQEVKEEPVVEEPAAQEVKEEKKAPAKKPAAKKAPAKKPAEKKAPAKKPAAKKAVVVATVANDKDEVGTGVNGKWRIEKEDVGFIASLFANNGQLLLNSESYTTFKGAVKGIDTIKKNAESGVFHVVEDKNGRYFFKLLSKQNRVICVGATYASKDGCESAIESVKNFCKTAILVSVDPDEAAKKEAAAANKE